MNDFEMEDRIKSAEEDKNRIIHTKIDDKPCLATGCFNPIKSKELQLCDEHILKLLKEGGAVIPIEDADRIQSSGSLMQERQEAKRDKMDNVRYDLVSPWMIESLAKTFAEGAAKYGDQNWRKGLPFSNLLNHTMNHLVKYAMGDTSEPHLDHAFWNIGAMIEFRETGREPELNDLFFHKKKANPMLVPAGALK